jgi:hypothetical protein
LLGGRGCRRRVEVGRSIWQVWVWVLAGRAAP